MYKLLLIAIGGGLGTLARYGTGSVLRIPMERTGFPFATLAVNILGCFLIGYLNGLFAERLLVRVEYRQMLLVGFLGGFTTFSTFGYETIAFLQDAQYWRATLNVLANNGIGLLLVIAGYALGHGRL